ncbi:MAG: WD40/YVTN/BNR-like repeat-containing protein, partial [Burkholderiales bacterium]
MARTIAIIAGVIILVAGYGPAAVSEAAEAGHHGTTVFEHVHALTFDAAARSLWLGAHAGLFRSEDGGRTWTKVALPVKHDAPDAMAVTLDPRDAGTLYVGTHEAG